MSLTVKITSLPNLQVNYNIFSWTVNYFHFKIKICFFYIIHKSPLHYYYFVFKQCLIRLLQLLNRNNYWFEALVNFNFVLVQTNLIGISLKSDILNSKRFRR